MAAVGARSSRTMSIQPPSLRGAREVPKSCGRNATAACIPYVPVVGPGLARTGRLHGDALALVVRDHGTRAVAAGGRGSVVVRCHLDLAAVPPQRLYRCRALFKTDRAQFFQWHNGRVEMERHGASDVERREAAGPTPSANDALWKDVAKHALRLQAEKVPVVGLVLAVREDRANARRLRLIEETIARLDTSVNELEDRLRTDPDTAEIWARAWNIAAEARSSEKVRVLATVVAAVTGGERLDASAGNILLSVVEGLEPLHLQTLVDVDTEGKRAQPTNEGGPERVWGARRDVLEKLSGVHPEVLGIALADLQAKQLVQNAYANKWGAIEGKEAFVLTTLGNQVRKLMLEIAEEAPIDPVLRDAD